MVKRVIRAHEDVANQIEPVGELPATKDPHNGDGGSAGAANCPDGGIWNAHTRQCEDSDTGDASVRSISEPVAAGSSATGEAETPEGVDVPDVKDVAGLPDENEGDPKTDLGGDSVDYGDEPSDSLPVTSPGGATKVTQERYGRAGADRRSAGKSTRKSNAQIERAEALKALEIAEMRVKAKELLAKEKELDARIRTAKEGAKPKALVNAPKATQANGRESSLATEVSRPSDWFRRVQREENVPSSLMWHINKEKIYENYGRQFVKKYDANENEVHLPVPRGQLGKYIASEAVSVTGPASGDFMRIMSEQVLVLPSGKVVTPIRQFCETKILPPGTKEAFFFDFGAVTFADITEDATTKVTASTPIIRSAAVEATPRGTRLDIGYTQTETSPIDIIASANRSFALESINDESKEVLQQAYNIDTGSSGDATTRKAVGGGTKAGRWVDGNSGVDLTADASGLGVLKYTGLLAAKGVIQDEGLDDSNLICYTSGKGIRDLTLDADLDSYIGFSRPAIITEATVERIAGINLVRSSANGATTQSGGTRSVVFIPNVALGLVSGRDLTMEAQRRNEFQIIHLTGTQRIGAQVKNVEATCRISHL